jgi:hypothetical protein
MSRQTPRNGVTLQATNLNKSTNTPIAKTTLDSSTAITDKNTAGTSSRPSTPMPQTEGNDLQRDSGDSLQLLARRGVTEANCQDPTTLAVALGSLEFLHFQTGTRIRKRYAVEERHIQEIQAIIVLLNNMGRTQAISERLESIEDKLASIEGKVSNHESPRQRTSWATIANPAVYPPTATKPSTTNHAHPQKDDSRSIFISLKNVSSPSKLRNRNHNEVVRDINNAISRVTSEWSKSGNYERMPQKPPEDPIKAVKYTTTGNLIIYAKDEEAADRVRMMNEEWLRIAEPNATTPTSTYAVVAAGAPHGAFDGRCSVDDAKRGIERENAEGVPLYSIANLTWLCNQHTVDRDRKGPLMISFKNRRTANYAIEKGLSMYGTMLNITRYIPRTKQCYVCQGWGHIAAGCPEGKRAKCGRCGDDHLTKDHKCTHNPPCSQDRRRCRDELSICANCGKDHPAWSSLCHIAQHARNLRENGQGEWRETYSQRMPPTFADVNISRPQNSQARRTAEWSDINTTPEEWGIRDEAAWNEDGTPRRGAGTPIIPIDMMNKTRATTSTGTLN